MKTFVISFSLLRYTNPLVFCPPAASSSVQSPQGFVAIIIIFSQHALCPLEGWFDRSSLVICLKAGFSSSLQHRHYAPPPLQVLSVELVLPRQYVLFMALPPEKGHKDIRCAGLWDTDTTLIMSIVDCCLSNRLASSSPCHYQGCAVVI